jgi:selenide,water dikinase
MALAVRSMTTLNKYASEIVKKYHVHGCTDVTGFGFLVHLCEMLTDRFSAHIDASAIPFIPECPEYVEEFYLTAAGQRNRNHVENHVAFIHCSFAMEEILFDAQTSGGLLVSMPPEDGEKAIEELKALGLPCGIVGRVTAREEKTVIIEG